MTQWDAQGYERISALQQQMAAEALAQIELKGSERVLDVGCGSGRITAALAAKLPQGEVVGVDASSDMIAFATDGANKAGLMNLRYEVCDARDLPFREEFDVAVSFNAMHWIPEQEPALRSLHRALRPGAVAQLRLVPKGERRSLEDVLEETRQSPRWRPYFLDATDPYLHLSAEAYGQLAEQCGFETQHCQVSDKSWDFHSRENFFHFGEVTFVAWTRHLSAESRPDFIQDTLDRYRKVACKGPGEENLFRFYQMDLRLLRR